MRIGRSSRQWKVIDGNITWKQHTSRKKKTTRKTNRQNNPRAHTRASAHQAGVWWCSFRRLAKKERRRRQESTHHRRIKRKNSNCMRFLWLWLVTLRDCHEQCWGGGGGCFLSIYIVINLERRNESSRRRLNVVQQTVYFQITTQRQFGVGAIYCASSQKQPGSCESTRKAREEVTKGVLKSSKAFTNVLFFWQYL